MTHVVWTQRFIVSTNVDNLDLREMVGTIKRCAHPALIAHLLMPPCPIHLLNHSNPPVNGKLPPPYLSAGASLTGQLCTRR
jgi:hypothetical protein